MSCEIHWGKQRAETPYIIGDNSVWWECKLDYETVQQCKDAAQNAIGVALVGAITWEENDDIIYGYRVIFQPECQDVRLLYKIVENEKVQHGTTRD